MPCWAIIDKEKDMISIYRPLLNLATLPRRLEKLVSFHLCIQLFWICFEVAISLWFIRRVILGVHISTHSCIDFRLKPLILC